MVREIRPDPQLFVWAEKTDRSKQIGNEIPKFKTCPICKHAQPASMVVHDAFLDGRKVKICERCYRRHYADAPQTKRQRLLEG